MNAQDQIVLGSVQETLFLPLWGRAVETKKEQPLLVDNTAVAIIESIPYDFSVIAHNVSPLSRVSWIARSLYFDKQIKEFLGQYSDAIVVNVGCGLDTTFERVDNGRLQWIDLDLPDVIALRKQYIPENERRKCISCSVFDTCWYQNIKHEEHVMLLIAGVLYYFEEVDIKRLWSDIYTFIPGTEVVFDYSSPLGIKMANKQVIDKAGMNRSAYLKWGIDNIMDLEQWDPHIKVMHHMPMFQEYRQYYPMRKRIGMMIADRLKVMSLAHIQIE